MIKINLLPVREERRRLGARQEQMLFLLVLVLVFVGIFLWHSAVNRKIKDLRFQISSTDAKITELAKVVAEVEKFKKDKKVLEEKIAVIDKLKRNRQLQVHYMDELNRALTPQVWITFYQQQGVNLAIRGRSLSTDDIADFMRKLDASEFFEDVRLVQTTQTSVALGSRSVKVNDFSLQVTVTSGPAGA